MNPFDNKLTIENLPNINTEQQRQISNEIDSLQQYLINEISTVEYRNFLYKTTQSIDLNLTEAKLLEHLVPLWVNSRNKEIPDNIPIDDFYRHLEHVLLLQLIIEFANSANKNPLKVKKMRDIIRRYSIMPTLWQYLCEVAGDTPTDAYTF